MTAVRQQIFDENKKISHRLLELTGESVFIRLDVVRSVEEIICAGVVEVG